MRRLIPLATIIVLASSCGLSSLNPFSKKEEPVYTPYIPVESQTPEKTNLKGVENVLFYMKKEFSPKEGEIVLNSYDGYIIDLGKKDGVSPGDTFVAEKSGAILKVKEVKNDYAIALPTIGKPIVGEKVQKYSFNKILYLDFTKEKGKKLYKELKEKLPYLHLSDYTEGEKFKKVFHLKYPADFKRKVPADKLTGYDGYFVVSSEGVEVFDGTKRLLKVFPWNGTPAASFTIGINAGYSVVANLKTHATSLFTANIDKSPQEEIVVSEEDKIEVFHPTPTGLSKVYTFKNPFPGTYLFHVSPLNINDSETNLIIVDGFDQESKTVFSGIFKVKNGKLVRVAESKLILSGFDTNGDGVNDAVFGQEVSDVPDQIFGKKVWKLKLSNGKLKKIEEVRVPPEFQVTSAQLFKNNGHMYFAYYDLDYFFDVAAGKTVIWRSPIQIGASPNCLYWYNEDSLVSYYITPKPVPIDIDGDGNEEVLFSQNKNVVPGILRNIYTFDGGRILLLYRNGDNFDWEEATNPIYNLGGIEGFDYLPDYDVFISIFTKASILKNPTSKLLFIKPKI
ncbi:hypothetical protein SAMN06265339_1558 [Desulfurobacterium pacificum]|uniref:VCBS repeat-containing protein n=1 Tax=Desulfurobacterium pacificum TaxID=240166 RepID=A0ABY1NTT6_9BACT|nr:hypothetical protein [Desulfurobacterium pacificum]SMP17759.1 hypothetical protein SAMN06265339_1558 [Desulfurobacterium pacificum]